MRFKVFFAIACMITVPVAFVASFVNTAGISATDSLMVDVVSTDGELTTMITVL
jgi:hypothetical protein